ncbi:MAG: protein kinase domain-containing protein [Actinomycetota bacterium]
MERRVISGYEVGGPIGFGAGGAAFAVRDRDGRSLAAVVVPDDERLERLVGLRNLHHPHLPRIRDVVAVGDEAAVVMDLVVGPSLATLVNARSWLSQGEVATLWRGIGDALAALHRRDLVHGDVSPANVVIGPGGIPVLVDVVGHAGAERGHTGYVPPELDDGPATTASDVWSLARTLTWASGEDADVARHVGMALADDPLRRPTARDFAMWSYLLGDGAELEVPAAADLAGAQLRSVAAPTVLKEARASSEPPWAVFALAVIVAVTGLLVAGRALGLATRMDDTPRPARAVAVPASPEGVRAVVASLLADRDVAVAAADAVAVRALYLPGAAVADADAALAATLGTEGTVLEGYGTVLLDLETSEVRSRAFTARIEVQQRAHRRTGPDGVQRFVERQDAHCVLVEAVRRGEWLIEEVTPCPST